MLGIAVCVPAFANGAGEQGAAEEGPVTLDAWIIGIDVPMQDGIQDDPVSQLLTEETGVVLNVSSIKKFANPQERYATALAGGTLPDIFRLLGSIAPEAVSAGALLELDDYVEEAEYIDNELMLEAVRLRRGTDARGRYTGKLWGIGTGIRDGSAVRPLVSFITRWDLYAELGYPEIRTYEDYLGVLQDMLELEPVNDQGQKNYALSGWWGSDLWTVRIFAYWLMGFETLDGPNGQFSAVWDHETQSVRNVLTDPDSPLWRTIAFYNEANQMGILDPDAPVMKQQDYVAKCNAGRIFSMLGYWHATEINRRYTEEGEGRGFVSMPPPTDDPRPAFLYHKKDALSRIYSISANTEHPDKAFGVLDFMHSDLWTLSAWSGVQGDTWDMVDGEPTLRPEAIDGYFNDPNYMGEHGIELYKHFNRAWVTNPMEEFGGVPASLFNAPEIIARNLTPVEQTQADYYGVTTMNEMFATENAKLTDLGVPFALDLDRALAQMPEDERDELESIAAEITAYRDNAIVQAIMAPTDAEFEARKAKAIEQFIELGSNDLYDYFANLVAEIR
jgi:ABC-type glycerol-3-phosphate transport system substrate-binding protein